VPQWARLPRLDRREWVFVAVGAMLCTFLTPILSTTALFLLEVPVCIALTSTGPILSLPLAYLIKGEKITYQSILGAVLACSGVALFAHGR